MSAGGCNEIGTALFEQARPRGNVRNSLDQMFAAAGKDEGCLQFMRRQGVQLLQSVFTRSIDGILN